MTIHIDIVSAEGQLFDLETDPGERVNLIDDPAAGAVTLHSGMLSPGTLDDIKAV